MRSIHHMPCATSPAFDAGTAATKYSWWWLTAQHRVIAVDRDVPGNALRKPACTREVVKRAPYITMPAPVIFCAQPSFRRTNRQPPIARSPVRWPMRWR